MSDKGIQLINLGGKDKRQQNKQLLRSILKDFNKDDDNIIYLFDNDVTFEMTKAELKDLIYFAVGKQDIEDSISSEIWVKIVNERLAVQEIVISVAEIDNIKKEIPQNNTIESNKKFYPTLKRELKKKLKKEEFYIIDDAFPHKGKNSGLMLIEYIDDVSKIPANISEAFKKLLI